jgi:hypothetical protein
VWDWGLEGGGQKGSEAGCKGMSQKEDSILIYFFKNRLCRFWILRGIGS